MNQHNQYTCPMHSQIVRDGPGKCPICGMNLVPIKKPEGDHIEAPQPHSHGHQPESPVQSSSGELYYCPILCEGDKLYSTPGNCPGCGLRPPLRYRCSLSLWGKWQDCAFRQWLIRPRGVGSNLFCQRPWYFIAVAISLRA